MYIYACIHNDDGDNNNYCDDKKNVHGYQFYTICLVLAFFCFYPPTIYLSLSFLSLPLLSFV